MRSTINRKSVATMYALGLIWTVAMVGGAYVLAQPMAELYEVVGIENALVETVGTIVLVMVLATLVTAGVALVLRATADHGKAAHHA